MESFNLPEDQPIESKLVSKVVNEAQKKVEGFNFDSRKHLLEYDDILNKQRTTIYRKRQELLEKKSLPQILGMLDILWMNHLENMEALRESVGMRAYGQHDPLVEYRRESHIMFKDMMNGFDKWLEENKEKIEEAQKNMAATQNNTQTSKPQPSPEVLKKIGRNDFNSISHSFFHYQPNYSRS